MVWETTIHEQLCANLGIQKVCLYPGRTQSRGNAICPKALRQASTSARGLPIKRRNHAATVVDDPAKMINTTYDLAIEDRASLTSDIVYEEGHTSNYTSQQR